jgi:DNA-binding transcriptional ArsR family regulator
MEELTETFLIENLEQLRVLADPLRIRILEQLVQRPMTMSQLGDAFGGSTAKMHYHVRELEKFGFIKLVEKREHGGFIEKYYRAVAKDVRVPPDLLLSAPMSELARTIQDYFENVSREVLRSITQQQEQACFTVTDVTLWATGEEFDNIQRQLQAIVAPYHERRDILGEQPWLAHFVAHTFVQDGEDSSLSKEK